MIFNARNGGSITPQYVKKLQNHIKSNKVAIHQNAIISSGTWDSAAKKWSLELADTSTIPPSRSRISLPKTDHIIYATGMPVKASCIPCLSSLLSSHPIGIIGDLPCLKNDLMWNDNVPLFVSGRLAGLRCGPWAGNLDGVRQSAERISWKVGELLNEHQEVEGVPRNKTKDREYADQELDVRRLGLGFENSFGVFASADL